MQKPLTRKSFIQQCLMAAAAIGLQPLQAIADTPNKLVNVLYFTNKDTEYELLRKGFNKRINNYPKIIAVVNNEAGVVEAIKYAKQLKLKVTAKSGGHCMEGFSSLPNGMVINLTLLNTISLQNNVVTVGPAVKLKQLYEHLLPKGKYVPGGSCQTVAIGGLTLGGGYGLLSRTYGLTCDSLIEATMVDGNGEVHKTTSNDQLLWALKGGGNGNFGIVTQMKFTAHNAPKTMQSYKFRCQNVTLANAKQICKDWFTYSPTLPNSCFSAFIFNGKTTYILLTNIGKNTTPVQEFIQKFKASATKYTEGKPLPIATALKAYYAEANPITFKNASSGLYKSFADIEAAVDNVFTLITKSPGILYQVNTLGGAIQNQNFVKNASFAHRDYLFFSELQAYWESASQTDKKLQQFQAIQKEFEKVGVKAQYRNYPDINFVNWKMLYYGQHLNALEQIKKQYDPYNTFGGAQTL
jgi:FAD binding domain/Berberine and berberine like